VRWFRVRRWRPNRSDRCFGFAAGAHVSARDALPTMVGDGCRGGGCVGALSVCATCACSSTGALRARACSGWQRRLLISFLRPAAACENCTADMGARCVVAVPIWRPRAWCRCIPATPRCRRSRSSRRRSRRGWQHGVSTLGYRPRGRRLSPTFALLAGEFSATAASTKSPGASLENHCRPHKLFRIAGHARLSFGDRHSRQPARP
jgi:hypothetical protein